MLGQHQLGLVLCQALRILIQDWAYPGTVARGEAGWGSHRQVGPAYSHCLSMGWWWPPRTARLFHALFKPTQPSVSGGRTGGGLPGGRGRGSAFPGLPQRRQDGKIVL